MSSCGVTLEEEGPARKVARLSGADEAGPSTSAGHHAAHAQEQEGEVQSCVLPDLPDDVLAIIAGTIAGTWEEDPMYDASDVCRDAAALALVRHPFTVALAQHLFQIISPRLGDDLGDLSSKSTASEMKAKLKEWGLPVTGSKQALWQRLSDEVEGVEEDGPYASISRSAKAKVLLQAQARISKTKAVELFDLYKGEVEQLPGLTNFSARFGSYKTYLVRDVKRLAVKRWGSYAKLLATREGYKTRQSERDALGKQRKDLVLQKLIARGYNSDLAQRGMGHCWWLEYLRAWRMVPVSEAQTTATADRVETYIWHTRDTTFQARFQELKASHVYRKSPSQYKQDIALEERAYVLAMQDWVGGHATLAGALATPGLPAHLKLPVQAAWQRKGAAASGSK